MNTSEYILATLIVVIGFSSFVVSSRKSGVIAGYRLSSGAKHTLNKAAFGDYSRIMLLVIALLAVIGSLFSQDALTVLEFTGMSTAFIGYALAWEKLIRIKNKED